MTFRVALCAHIFYYWLVSKSVLARLTEEGMEMDGKKYDIVKFLLRVKAWRTGRMQCSVYYKREWGMHPEEIKRVGVLSDVQSAISEDEGPGLHGMY